MTDPGRSPRGPAARRPAGGEAAPDLERLADRVAAGQLGWPDPGLLDDAAEQRLVALVRRRLRQRLVRLIARLIARDLRDRAGHHSKEGVTDQ